MLDDTLVAFLTISINLEIYLRQLTISLSTCQSDKRLHLDLDTQTRKPGHKSTEQQALNSWFPMSPKYDFPSPFPGGWGRSRLDVMQIVREF